MSTDPAWWRLRDLNDGVVLIDSARVLDVLPGVLIPGINGLQIREAPGVPVAPGLRDALDGKGPWVVAGVVAQGEAKPVWVLADPMVLTTAALTATALDLAPCCR